MSELSDDHEEYDPHSTVTDEERFAPLSTVALSLFSDLAQRYSVTVSAAFDASPTMSPIGNAYPPITRSPSDGGATLSVAFPSSVSLVLRCGWWHAESFPSCSCDGCDLTLAREAERFVELCAAVVAGTVHEALETAPVWYGSARLSHTFNSRSSAARCRRPYHHSKRQFCAARGRRRAVGCRGLRGCVMPPVERQDYRVSS